MRLHSVSTVILSGLMVTGAAMSASAQSATETRRAFAGISFAPTTTATAVSPISFKTSIAPAPRQASTMPITPFIFGGLAGPGVGVGGGGGLMLANLAGREEFGLQIDGLISSGGGCPGLCGALVDFSTSALSIAGAFIYKFKETAGGWQPFAGGGPVFTRYSYSVDDFDYCDADGVTCSSVGLQVQGGVAKGNLHIEGRVQGTAGGAFLGLVGYKFGRR